MDWRFQKSRYFFAVLLWVNWCAGVSYLDDLNLSVWWAGFNPTFVRLPSLDWLLGEDYQPQGDRGHKGKRSSSPPLVPDSGK